MDNYQTIKNNLLSIVSDHGWKYVAIHEVLPEKFMKEFWEKLDKTVISYYQMLSEFFMREKWGELNKINIVISQLLSESFMREKWAELNLAAIVKYQKLSDSFIREKFDDLSPRDLCEYQKLSVEIIEEFWEVLKNYTKILITYQDLPFSFFEHHWVDFLHHQRYQCGICNGLTKMFSIPERFETYSYCPKCKR